MDHGEVEKVLTALKARFPGIRAHSGVCDASRTRQKAVLDLAKRCDLILVIGSAHSSNAKRLQEIAERQGRKAFLLDNADELPETELERASVVGVTSGASTPEYLFSAVTEALERRGFRRGGDGASGTPRT